MNVSLSVPIGDEQAEVRKQVHQANAFFRRQFHIKWRSTKESGVGAFMKRAVFLLSQKTRSLRG